MDHDTSTDPVYARDGSLADLADLVLTIARELQGPHTVIDGVVPLTPTETSVLRYLDRHPAASPTATASATGLLRSNLSTVLRSLQGKGLVRRDRPVHDARAVELTLTPLARDCILRVHRHWRSQLSEALGNDLRGTTDALRLLARVETGLTTGRTAIGGRVTRRAAADC